LRSHAGAWERARMIISCLFVFFVEDTLLVVGVRPSPQPTDLPAMESGRGVSELAVAAMVAVFLDQSAGGGEVVLRRAPRVVVAPSEQADAGEEGIRLIEGHRATLGELPGLTRSAMAPLLESGSSAVNHRCQARLSRPRGRWFKAPDSRRPATVLVSWSIAAGGIRSPDNAGSSAPVYPPSAAVRRA